MKKIILASIIIILTVLYGTVGAVLFFNIEVLKAPETAITLDILEINAEQAIIQTTINMTNPNPFELVTKDFELILLTETGTEISRLILEGGDIQSQKTKTFTKITPINFHGASLKILTAKLSGTLGVSFFGIIQKTIPFTITIKTSIGQIIEDIAPPIISVFVNMSDISQEGAKITGLFDIYNPNSFEMYAKNMTVNIKNETGKIVGTMTVDDAVIMEKQSQKLNVKGMVQLIALNSEILTMSVSGTAGIKIAGLDKSFAFSVDSQLHIPNVKDIFPSISPTLAVIKADMKATLRGFISYMTLEIQNPNPLALTARDVTFSIYRVDGDKQTFIGDCVVAEATVAAKATTNIDAQVTLPYLKLFTPKGKGFIPDGLLVIVQTNVTLSGLDQYYWIGVSGYQDLHAFR
ncbi:MAG: LEA type 2 family protein [Euryarchaeota archaeon]|nr:LEA type 2 family protein [Euryarchaeota archaeon]